MAHINKLSKKKSFFFFCSVVKVSILLFVSALFLKRNLRVCKQIAMGQRCNIKYAINRWVLKLLLGCKLLLKKTYMLQTNCEKGAKTIRNAHVFRFWPHKHQTCARYPKFTYCAKQHVLIYTDAWATKQVLLLWNHWGIWNNQNGIQDGGQKPSAEKNASFLCLIWQNHTFNLFDLG